MKSSENRVIDALNRIKSQGDDVVFTRTYEKEALLTARAFDKGLIKPSSIAGKIISIKDLFDVKGEVTTAGSKILRDSLPALKNSPIVTRLKRAGAIIIGKTNMSEFAFHGLGTNPHFGNAGNALNKAHVPGGSSSGAAVSVAEGTSDIAIGTDTGGSIRLPASFNGVVGYKPSQKRITREGAFPLAHSLDSIGPLAKTLQECIDTDGILAGVTHSLTPLQPQNIRLALPRGYMIDEASNEVKTAFNHSLELLKKAGVTLIEVDINAIVEEIMVMLAKSPLVAIEAAAIHKEFILARPTDYDPPVIARLKVGLAASGVDYIRALWKREELIKRYRHTMRGFHAMIAPTSLITAPRIDEVLSSTDAFLKYNARALRNTTIGNILDVCGLSLPCPKVENMPVGVMLMAINGQDEALMQTGLALERALSS